jgi:hypothetical protein
MKKLIILAAITIFAGLLTGCASIPKYCNMTGTWNYTFEETGKSGTQTGSMKIAQESYKIIGKCNDAFGEFELSGTLDEESPKFSIDGKRNDGKRNFRLTGTLTSDTQFEGTYTTDQNTSGILKGTRVTAK